MLQSEYNSPVEEQYPLEANVNKVTVLHDWRGGFNPMTRMSSGDIEEMRKAANEIIDKLTKEQLERLTEFLMKFDPKDQTPDD